MPIFRELITPFTALTISLTPFLTYILNTRHIIGDLEMLIIDIIVIGVGATILHRQMKKEKE
ncbi:MAG: hypothetical protein NDF57_01315 [archaeon GBS-70-058]|nr:hypothetical protein [Candidatus Culexarchaeum nevadense]